jgi:hypothetical protein
MSRRKMGERFAGKEEGNDRLRKRNAPGLLAS